ncbi:hypothetical protein MYX78_12450 [Acidobacteria bacterium AH-259-G07]|nr:hypothetical protein [Acidobacteria bacterium AH-259-G07]
MPSEDDFQRRMDFLLDQQAQFYADLRKLDERVDRNSKQISQLMDLLFRMGGVVEEMARQSDERFNRLVEAQEGTDARLNHLAEAQQGTDERLNVLINVVERYFSNGNRS